MTIAFIIALKEERMRVAVQKDINTHQTTEELMIRTISVLPSVHAKMQKVA